MVIVGHHGAKYSIHTGLQNYFDPNRYPTINDQLLRVIPVSSMLVLFHFWSESRSYEVVAAAGLS